MNAAPRLPALLIAIGALSACASSEPSRFRTVPGAETPAVLAGAGGHIAIARPGDDLPCNPVRAIANARDSACVLYRVAARSNGESGIAPESAHSQLIMKLETDPTDFRNVAFALVRRHCMSDRSHCLPDEETLATWRGSSRGALYRKALAVSPDGRRAAVLPLSQPVRIDGYAPPAPDGYHFQVQQDVGELVLVDLRSGERRNTRIDIVDGEPITWSGDGRRLLFVRVETMASLPNRLRENLRGSEGRPDGLVPVVEAWDVGTGTIEMLAIGMSPVWSADQKTLIYAPCRATTLAFYAGERQTLSSTPNDRFELLDLSTGDHREIVVPGMIGRNGPIAFVGPRKLLYWALPTVGTAPAGTGHNSPMVGPKQMMALKVADLDTLQFATVYPRIDPRAEVGYTNGY